MNYVRNTYEYVKSVFSEEPFSADILKGKLKYTKSEAVTMKQRKQNMIMKLEKQIADFLRENRMEEAKMKTEEMIREMKLIEVYGMLTTILDNVVSRTKYIEDSDECPQLIQEAVTTLIWCATRTELDSLIEVREMFRKKYGEFFVKQAAENSTLAVKERIYQLLRHQIYHSHVIMQHIVDIATKYNIDIQAMTQTSNPQDVAYPSVAPYHAPNNYQSQYQSYAPPPNNYQSYQTNSNQPIYQTHALPDAYKSPSSEDNEMHHQIGQTKKPEVTNPFLKYRDGEEKHQNYGSKESTHDQEFGKMNEDYNNEEVDMEEIEKSMAHMHLSEEKVARKEQSFPSLMDRFAKLGLQPSTTTQDSQDTSTPDLDAPEPPQSTPLKKARALYDYEGNGEDELAFLEGDILSILELSSENGWVICENSRTMEQGMVPENYIEECIE